MELNVCERGYGLSRKRWRRDKVQEEAAKEKSMEQGWTQE